MCWNVIENTNRTTLQIRLWYCPGNGVHIGSPGVAFHLICSIFMTRDIFQNNEISTASHCHWNEKLCKCKLKHWDNIAQKMILSNLFLQRLQYFRAQVQRELLGGEQQRIFGVWEANQNASSTPSTVLAYTKLKYTLFPYVIFQFLYF